MNPKIMAVLLIFSFILLWIIAPRLARAACASLVTLGTCSTAGQWDYDTTNNTYKFCNGTNWVSAKGTVSATACSTAARMDYASGKYSFCNGSFLVDLYSGSSLGACSQAGAKEYDTTNSTYKVCDGSAWKDVGAQSQLSSLAGWWKMNEGSGTTASDSSGNGNNGTLTNGPTWTGSGKIGNALSFDATNDYVSIPNSTSLNITGQLTIAAWVKKNSLSGDDDIVSKGTYHTYYLQYSMVTEGDEFGLYFCNLSGADCTAGGGQFYLSTNANLTTGTWYHLAIVYNDSANSIVLYKNGSAVSGTSAFGTPLTNSIISTTQPLVIGELVDGEETDGVLDDVRIYNAALSAAQIAAIYNSGTGCP